MQCTRATTSFKPQSQSQSRSHLNSQSNSHAMHTRNDKLKPQSQSQSHSHSQWQSQSRTLEQRSFATHLSMSFSKPTPPIAPPPPFRNLLRSAVGKVRVALNTNVCTPPRCAYVQKHSINVIKIKRGLRYSVRRLAQTSAHCRAVPMYKSTVVM